MTAPNEQFALAILEYLDANLVTGMCPDFAYCVRYKEIASSGERALYNWALAEWRGDDRSLSRTFSKLDRETRQLVILMLENIYLSPLKEPIWTRTKP